MMLRNFEALHSTMAGWHGNGNQYGGNLDQRCQESGVRERIKEMYGDTLASSTIILFLILAFPVQLSSSWKSYIVAQWQSGQRR